MLNIERHEIKGLVEALTMLEMLAENLHGKNREISNEIIKKLHRAHKKFHQSFSEYQFSVRL